MPDTYRRNLGPFTVDKLISFRPTSTGFRVSFSDDTSVTVDGNAVKLVAGNVLELVANRTVAGVVFDFRVVPPGGLAAPVADNGGFNDSTLSEDLDFCVGFDCPDVLPCPDPNKPNLDCVTISCIP